jgi:hypothetical protein
MLGFCLFAVGLPVSEVELFGYAALVFLAAHLFTAYVWPAARDCVCTVYSDVVAAARRAKQDIKSLRE